MADRLEQALANPSQEPSPAGDEPVKCTVHEQDGGLIGDWQQPGWDRLLDGVRVIRDNRLAKDLRFGRPELEIPVGMLYFLKQKYPELDSKDSQIKTRAWKRFLASPESLPFRVRGRGGFLNRSVGGLDHGG